MYSSLLSAIAALHTLLALGLLVLSALSPQCRLSLGCGWISLFYSMAWEFSPSSESGPLEGQHHLFSISQESYTSLPGTQCLRNCCLIYVCMYVSTYVCMYLFFSYFSQEGKFILLVHLFQINTLKKRVRQWEKKS